MGAPSPLGERGAPKEQARAIVARIINFLPGGGPHSGQTSASPRQARNIRGARGRGGQGRRGGRGGGEKRGRGREEGEHSQQNNPLPYRASSQRWDDHTAREREEATAEEDPAEQTEEEEEERDRDRETSQGGPVEVTRVGGYATPPEENADIPGFTPERAHLLLQGVYGDFPHHNDGSHLDGGIADDSARQRHWCRIAAQSASCYATPSVTVGRRFTATLAA